MNYFDNHFLFSETFINEYIKEENKKKARENNDAENAFKLIKEWNNEFVKGDYKNDPWFNYIDSILDVLGFQKRVQNENRIIYANTINENEKPIAVCHFVDKNESIASTRKGKYYAYNALKAAKEQGVNWAMLTNGYQWRIYNTNNVSPYENYLEVDIEESIQNNNQADDGFKLFYLFFNVRTYYTRDGELEIEKIKDLSDKKAETIEDTLRGKAEEILKELCYGLKEDMGKESYTEEEKKGIYNDAIILLYRLLFFGYAESRGLLPIVENDPDYIESYKKICDDAKDLHNAGEVYQIKDGYEFWQRIDSQLRLYVDRSYNGGLFSNEDKPILKEHRIANGRLTKCLVELSYNSDKNGKYCEAIMYKDLSVRNLGSIYEGLLEYRLFIAEDRMVQRKSKGQVKYLKADDVKLQNSDLKNIIEKGGIYLSQDALERKETGAYYTPEDVVGYIVENTVGKKLNELKEKLQSRKKDLFEQLSYEPLESRKRMLQNKIDEIIVNFINEEVLSLSIIDSAMGSGHFLVNAAYWIANAIVEIISENDWESDEDVIADINYWKRKVVENCIYGIDINSLSVTLARLSLWLISASNDKALSFIDHHLKEGDSIIGTDRKHVEINGSKDNMFGNLSYEKYMEPILEKYQELKKVGSATKADVNKQKEIYEQIKDELKIAKKKYDYSLASQYRGGINKEEISYYNLLASNDIRDFEKEEMEPLWALAKEKKFFHWELEFSEVYQRGGFDITIGNPPYVEYASKEFISLSIENKDTGNLYAPMIETNLLNLNRNSAKYGFIVPIALVSTERMAKLQNVLISNSENIYISNFAVRPGKIFKKADMNISIVYGSTSKAPDCSVYTSNYIRWYTRDRKYLFTDVCFIKCNDYIKNGIIPKIGTTVDSAILWKLFAVKKKVKDYVDNCGSSIFLHSGGRYWRKSVFERFSTEYKLYRFNERHKYFFNCLFNSNLFYWFWIVYSDCYHVTKKDVVEFPIDIDSLSEIQLNRYEILSKELMADFEANSKKKERNRAGKVSVEKSYYPKYSKKIIDKIDGELATLFRFSGDEVDYIKNYDIRFRMGEESSSEDE